MASRTVWRSGSTSGRRASGDRPDAEAGRAALLALMGEEEGRLEERLAMHLERRSRPARMRSSTTATRVSGCDGTRRRATERCCGSSRHCGNAGGRRRRSGSARRRPAAPAKEAATDPPRAIAGLLELLAAVPGAAATNEANRPAQPLVRPASVPDDRDPYRLGISRPRSVTSDSGERAGPSRTRPSRRTNQRRPTTPPTATNEANPRPKSPPGPCVGWRSRSWP